MDKKEINDSTIVNFRSRKQIIANLDKCSKRKGMNRTSVINMLIVDFIKKEEEEEKKKERERK